MDIMISYGNKDPINMILSDKNSLRFVRISHSTKLFLELVIIVTAIYLFYKCSYTETQDLIYCFFIVFIFLYFIKIIFTLITYHKILTSEKYSDVRVNIFNIILEMLNNVFIFSWSCFGLSISRTFIISKFNIPEHLQATTTIFLLSISPFVFFLIISTILFIILWYLLNKIPMKKFSDLKHRPNEECHICLETFENDSDVKILNCKHYFHVHCCDQWVPREKTCPLCRRFVTRLDND